MTRRRNLGSPAHVQPAKDRASDTIVVEHLFTAAGEGEVGRIGGIYQLNAPKFNGLALLPLVLFDGTLVLRLWNHNTLGRATDDYRSYPKL